MNQIKYLVWLDLEMTGLNVDHCHIIEIASILTDRKLNIVAKSKSIAIYQPNEILATMDDWCTNTHTNSGLLDRVKKSSISVSEAEHMMLEFIESYVDKNTSPLCGNSVWQDRKFLAKYMPELEDYFHYRLLDVSSFKIAASLWKTRSIQTFHKQNTHLALNDVIESINEMKYYYKHFFID
jgi:oligoribonuclease